jgi:hypothetical protein
LMTYDALLRARFQRLFIFCSRMRRLFVNRVVLNRMVAAAARDDALTTQLVNIVLGNQAPADGVSLKTIMRVLLALLASRDSAKVAPGAKS